MLEYGSQLRASRNGRRIKINQGVLAARMDWDVHTLVDIENRKLGIDDETYRQALMALDEIESESRAAETAA